ncbi:TolC family protein [Membranihabitans marinus]|uniref:TolC family protein n=1 Tax=Membranihabitans marinus TaxID=1227546 RepID=UPI001F32E3AE|nr:TolC family protein [Membranihabitans marinus]
MRNTSFSILAIIFMVSVSLTAQNNINLTTAKSMAIESHVSIANSQLEIDGAKISQEEAKTHYYPQVNFDGMLMHSISPLLELHSPEGNLPVYDGNPSNLANATEFAYIPASTTGLLQKVGLANLTIAQPIYTGGKIKLGNEMASLGVDIREEQKRMTENEVLLNTEQQYWQIVALQEKQKTIDEYRRLLDQLYIQVNDAYQAGLIIRNDVYKVELERSQLEINTHKLQNGKELALRQFTNTIGMPFDSTLYLQDDLENFEQPQFYVNLNQDYLTQLSEIKLLEKSAEMQNLQTKMKEAGYKPTVAAGINTFYLTQFEEESSGVNALGFASVSIPLSHIWKGKHDIQVQKIEEEIVQNTLADTRELLQLRTAKSWTDLREAYEEIKIMEGRIVQANENLRVNQSSYENGVVTLSDFLEAKALQTQALDDLIDAKTKYKVAIATYLQHIGKADMIGNE